MYYKNKLIGSSILEDFFNGVLDTPMYSKSEVAKTANGYSIDVLIPGFLKEEISINYVGDDLIVTAKTERKMPSFLNSNMSKTFIVPSLDYDSIVAKLENGVLTITFSMVTQKSSKMIKVN